jgi:hypothetical protein
MQEMFVGSADGGSGYFDGYIDEVRVYQKVLDPNEIGDGYDADLKARHR